MQLLRFVTMFLIITMLVLVFQISNIAYSSESSFEKKIDMFLKVLGFDRNLLNKSGESIRIALIYNSKDPETQKLMPQIDDIFYNFVVAKRMVGIKLMSYSMIAFITEEGLEDKIKALKVDVLYIFSGIDDKLPSIIKVANNNKILTFSMVSNHLSKGAALGVEEIDGKPKIIINLINAKNQGADFKAALLKIAKVIE